jgi:hypothetical protein
MTRTLRLLLLAFAAAFTSSAVAAYAESICEREMTRAAARFDVPLGVLYAVGMTETGRKSGLSPYAMNIGGRPHWSANSPPRAARGSS